jgi:hypothetical protein
MNLRLDTKIPKLWPKSVDHYRVGFFEKKRLNKKQEKH